MRSTWRGVLTAGTWTWVGLCGNLCCCWMGTVRGWNSKIEREMVHPCNVCDKALSSLCQQLPSAKFGSIVAMCFTAMVVARSSTPTTLSTDTWSLCVASHTIGIVFASLWCGTWITIEKIILNMNVRGEEERKRTDLASSRKRADIFYHLIWKSSVFVFINFLCNFYFNIFIFYVLGCMLGV